MKDAKAELERIIQESVVYDYTDRHAGKGMANVYKKQLAQSILDAKFVRLVDMVNRLGPYKMMKPVYHKKERTIVFQEMTEAEKNGVLVLRRKVEKKRTGER